MPVITALPFDSSFISLSVERNAKRSDGIHLSAILKDLLLTVGVERKSKREITPEQQHLIYQKGFLWERLIREYIESRENQAIEWDRFVTSGLVQLTDDAIQNSNGAVVRPGECCLDGIYMTPDAINMKLWHGEEWKATALRSASFDIAIKRPEWLWQGASYNKAFGMKRTIYRIWHYGEMPPVVKQLVVEWTEDEINQLWERVLEHHEFMKKRSRAEWVG